MELDRGEQRVFFQAGGEWCYLWTPKEFNPNSPAPVLIHHHGARGYVRRGEADWLDTPHKASLLRAAMEGAGAVVVGSHACGDHWGNPCSVDANAALVAALEGVKGLNLARVGLMGGGLGGVLVWNSVLGPLRGRVSQVAVMQAVASLEAVVRHGKFKAPCLAAYGLGAETPDEEAIEAVRPSDPLPRLQKAVGSLGIKRAAIFHGAEDKNIPPKSHAIPLSQALEALGVETTLELFPGVGHNTYEMGEAMERRLRAFFSTL